MPLVVSKIVPKAALIAFAGRVADDCRGTVALIFALSVFVLVGIVGGAIDFARWHNTTNQMQNAMDSAVLAGGRVLQTNNNEGEALDAANQYFANMRSNWTSRGTAAFSFHENGTVIRGVMDGAITAPFLGVIGITELPVKIVSEAVLAAGGNAGTNVEISLMLDVTGSMAGQKLTDMKQAAKDMIDIVIWDDQSSYTSKVALAPFARRVNLGSYTRDVTNLRSNFSGNLPIECVTERTGPEEFTDARPNGSGNWINAFKGDREHAARDNAQNYSASGNCDEPSSDEAVMPLSSDRNSLKSHIDNFSAGGSTAGALGTAWAWYMISPNWDMVWPSNSRPAPYADLTRTNAEGQPVLKKYAILMTDGIYNTYGGVNFGDHSSEATTISNKAVQICNNMKAAGIKVYTIGFQLGGSTLATNTLKDCASRLPDDPPNQPSYFYETTSGEELRQAFREIALQIATLRVRK